MLKGKGLAHVPEDRQRMGLISDFKAHENLIFGYHDQEPFSKSSILNNKEITKHSNKVMQEYDVRPNTPNLITSNFSGGNQQKIIFDNILIDNNQNINIESFVKNYNVNNNKIFNKITFKNFVNNFFSAYAG